jgi:hypothetical protein
MHVVNRFVEVQAKQDTDDRNDRHLTEGESGWDRK